MTSALVSCLFQHYFVDAWNSFDALIVVGSVVDIVVTEFSVSTGRVELSLSLSLIHLSLTETNLSAVCLSEWGGQLSGVDHLLPPISSDAIGQAAEQRGGDSYAAVDVHQITTGQRAGLIWRGRC